MISPEPTLRSPIGISAGLAMALRMARGMAEQFLVGRGLLRVGATRKGDPAAIASINDVAGSSRRQPNRKIGTPRRAA